MRISDWSSDVCSSDLSTGAAAETLKFYGYAYDLKTNRYLYTEVHHQNVDGVRWLGGTILYYAADGTLIGDKTLDFSADPYIPVYRFDMKTDGYHEEIGRASCRERVCQYV